MSRTMLATSASRRFRLLAAVGLLALLAGCAETKFAVHSAKGGRGTAVPHPQSYYKVGAPYEVNGVWYYPQVDYDYDRVGIASWYGPGFHGRYTANGEVYDENDITAAHPTLPLPSVVRVTNLENGRSIAVRVNDRGPFVDGRIIDLSRRSAQLLGIERQGTARVRVQIMAPESRQLAALAQQGIIDVPALAEDETQAGRGGGQLAAAPAPSAATTGGGAATASDSSPVVQVAELLGPSATLSDAGPVTVGTAPVTPVVAQPLPPLPGAAATPPRTGVPAGGTATAATPPASAAPAQQADQPLSILATLPQSETSPPPRPHYVWGAGNMAPIIDGPGTKGPVARPDQPAAFEAVAAHREDGSAVIVAKESAALYVQAGAFSQQQNADAMRARLAAIGPTAVSPVRVGGRQLFRVRVGPVHSPEEAERLLKEVVSAGQPDARIVVETGS
ncbi:MAG: septal ring lytic transglycosylase RlpA family protein [Rhodospirillaceae bacterium]|nr:septal ring lytic transglycosylase RlpA family protein [Rhodospirillaceae bacterium]